MTDFAFTSQNSLLKCPPATAGHRYAVAGLPWDGAVTNRPGARFGPRAIREASHMLCDGVHPLFDVSPEGHLSDAGDLALPNTSLEAMRAAQPDELYFGPYAGARPLLPFQPIGDKSGVERTAVSRRSRLRSHLTML